MQALRGYKSSLLVLLAASQALSFIDRVNLSFAAPHFMQLLNITLSLAPVLLVFYLLARAGERPSSIGPRSPVSRRTRCAIC